MTWRKDFLRLIRDEYQTRRQKNSRYSIRAFARDIGVSPGPTSELIKGTKEWKFSERWALRILNKIPLTPAKKKKLLAKMGTTFAMAESAREADETLLTHWAKIPVLTSLDLPPPYNQLQNIAQRLGLRKLQVEEIVSELEEKGWVEKDSQGQLRRVNTMIQFNESLSTDALKKFHSDSLHLAERALQEMLPNQYDFHTVTLIGNAKDVEDLHKEIKALIQKANALMNQGEQNNEIFRININLFPLNFGKNET